MRRLLALVGALACFGWARDAAGQVSTNDQFWARQRADEGKRLMAGGQISAACRKFDESHRRVPDTGTLLDLAICHEREGKTATAYAEFEEAQQLAREDLDAYRSAERQKTAGRHLRALEPKLSRLTVVVGDHDDARAIEVRLDGAVLPPPRHGTPVIVDPGEHEVTVTAPGAKPWRKVVTIGASGDAQTVTVPPFGKDEPTASAVPHATPRPDGKGTAGGAPAAKSEGQPYRVWAYTRTGFAAYLSDARTIGGVGGGLGLRVPIASWFQLQADVSYLFMIGNALEVRVGGGVQRPGLYTPAATVLVSLFAGSGLRFLTDDHPAPISAPAVAAGLHLAPLRFTKGATHASLLEVGLGAGTDLPGLALVYEATLLEVGTAF